MIHGKNLIILADGVAIAAAKSCEISLNTEAYEVSSPATAGWRYRKVGRSEWSVSVSTLVTEIRTRFNLGQKVTLTMAVCDANGMTDDRLIGTAWLQKSEIFAQLGNLVQGSFTFQGIGVLQPPLYDAEIDYIETNGTQYINTGQVITTTTKLVFDGVFTDVSTTVNHGAISINGTTYKRFHMGTNSNSNHYFTAGIGTVVSDYNFKDTNRHTFQMLGSGSSAIDSTTKNGNSTVPDLAIYLCARNTNNEATQFCSFQLYSAQIYSGNTLVLDLIPVRKRRVGYMYDRVSNTLFGNDGTGAFILGPDKT